MGKSDELSRAAVLETQRKPVSMPDEMDLKSSEYKIPPVETLEDLIRILHKIFESDEVNVEYLHDVLSAYKSNPREWKPYALFDRHRYTRNLVDEGNGKFNLMLLCWAEGQGSSIHDHANSHCFMKMLSGSLTETRFEWPKESDDEDSPMRVTGVNVLKENEVAYINDSIGLHRVENSSHSETAVSLHLYSPPFQKCLMFDQRTGHKSESKVTFWSKYGKRTPFVPSDQTLIDPMEYENN